MHSYLLFYVIVGYTSVLQPCDVGLNKPMKGYVRDNFMMWCMQKYPMLNGNKFPVPSRTEISTWVSDAWEKISETTVRKSFRSSGYEIEENAGICDASSAEEGIDALSTSFYEALTLQPDW